MFKTNRWVTGLAATLLLATTAACGSGAGDAAPAQSNCTPAHEVKTISSGVLTVSSTDTPPVSIRSEGRFDGIEPTVIKRFATEYCLTLKIETMDFAAALQSVKSNRADLALGGYYRTASRAEAVGLTNAVWLDQMGIIAKQEISDVADIEGKKVGTVDGYLWVPGLKEVLGANLNMYPSAVELKADLEAGRIDVAVDSMALAAIYDGFTPAAAKPDDRIQATIEPAQVGFPFTKGNSSLEAALNDTIAKMHSDGAIKAALAEAALPEGLADVGAPRLVK
jgi:polar amino acid transport system substrate-binding protein